MVVWQHWSGSWLEWLLERGQVCNDGRSGTRRREENKNLLCFHLGSERLIIMPMVMPHNAASILMQILGHQ